MQSVMARRSEFVGQRFGRLLVTDVINVGVRAHRLVCVCDCGEHTTAAAFQLRTGDKKSCGCLKRSILGDASRTHGRANSRISGYADRAYGVWQAMKDRCANKNRKDWHCYGGKGVTVCKRWLRFENFLADMGEPPPGLTLDRKDGTKGYCKSNCEWATRAQQSVNTSNAVWIPHGGKTQTITAWREEKGVLACTYYARIKRGWSREEALLLVPRK